MPALFRRETAHLLPAIARGDDVMLPDVAPGKHQRHEDDAHEDRRQILGSVGIDGMSQIERQPHGEHPDELPRELKEEQRQHSHRITHAHQAEHRERPQHRHGDAVPQIPMAGMMEDGRPDLHAHPHPDEQIQSAHQIEMHQRNPGPAVDGDAYHDRGTVATRRCFGEKSYSFERGLKAIPSTARLPPRPLSKLKRKLTFPGAYRKTSTSSSPASPTASSVPPRLSLAKNGVPRSWNGPPTREHDGLQ